MIQELNIHALWAAGQTAKGAPRADVDIIHRFRHVGGGWLGINRDDGEQKISNLGKFGDSTDWVQSLSGTGAPPVEATPDELAFLLWLFEGGEVTTAVVGPPAKTKHTFTPIPGVGKYSSWRGRVGATQITREQYNDVLMSQLVIEGSTANQALRATPTLMSMDPGVVKNADPTQALPSKRPFMHAEGASRFELDDVVTRGHSQFTLTLALDLTPVYGDDNVIYDFAIGNAAITIGATVQLDAEGIAQYNRGAYGVAAPAADAKPIKRVSAIGKYEFDVRALDPTSGAVNGDKATLVIPGVKWDIPDRPPPNPAGGTAELAFVGKMRAIAGQPEYTLAVDCDAAAFTK